MPMPSAAAQRAVAHLGPLPPPAAVAAAACRRRTLALPRQLAAQRPLPLATRQAGRSAAAAAAAAASTAAAAAAAAAAASSRRRVQVAASGAAAADAGDDARPTAAPAAAAIAQPKRGWRAQLQPLSDPAANRKLLALSIVEVSLSVSMLMHDTYLPLYMSEVLHMSSTKMGNLHALLQFLTRASGIVSGRLADVFSPARMVIVGTLLTAAVCKPMFAACGLVRCALGTEACISWVTSAKVLDRSVKGLRETPAKALVGELAAASGDSAAAAFSVRQALSTLGMLVGSALAGLAYKRSGGSYEVTFGLSVVAAALSLALVTTALGADARAGAAARQVEATLASMDEEGEPLRLSLGQKAAALGRALRPAYWQALAVVVLLYQARFDVSFIMIHAAAVMPRERLAVLNVFSMLPVVLLATPMGIQAKKSVAARNAVLLLGFAVLVAGNLCYAFVPSELGVALGCACVGVHMAMTQGVLFGMIASVVPSQPLPGLGRISGTVWAVTDLALGLALAGSNTLAGRLTDLTLARGMGATGCFMGAIGATLAAALALLAFMAWGDLGREPEPAAPPPEAAGAK